MSDTQNATAENNEAEAPVLTREEKLRKKYDNLVSMINTYTEKANEIAQELNTLAALDSLDAGSVVTVRLGRADTTRYVEATIVAVKEDDEGSKQFKVQYGEGFDTEVAVVSPSKIVVEPPADGTPA